MGETSIVVGFWDLALGVAGTCAILWRAYKTLSDGQNNLDKKLTSLRVELVTNGCIKEVPPA